MHALVEKLTSCRDYRSLRRGKHRLYLWPGREADGSNETITPSKTGARDEMGRLEKVRRNNEQLYQTSHYDGHAACKEIRTWGSAQVRLAGHNGLPEDGGNTCCEI
jgi:hypothetical protein